MATTTGYVQQLSVFDSGLTCAWVGPSPSNVAALSIQITSGDSAASAAYKGSMVDALGAAAAMRQPVSADHDDSSSEITALTLGPF